MRARRARTLCSVLHRVVVVVVELLRVSQDPDDIARSLGYARACVAWGGGGAVALLGIPFPLPMSAKTGILAVHLSVSACMACGLVLLLLLMLVRGTLQ